MESQEHRSFAHETSTTESKSLTSENQKLLKKQQEMEYWKLHVRQVRRCNIISWIAVGTIGACVLLHSLHTAAQEILAEMAEEEAKALAMKAPETEGSS